MSIARLASSTALSVVLCLSTGCGGCGSKKDPARAKSAVKSRAAAAAAKAPKPPPVPPPPAAAADGTYTVAGLRYLEIVTGGARASESLPMVVALHGHGGSPEVFRKDFTSYRGKARFILAFGVEPAENGKFEWFRKKGLEAAVLSPVISRLAGSIKEIQRVRPTSGKPIITGFSQGAVMTYGLALLRGDAIAVACPMAGQLPSQMLTTPSLPAPPRPEVHAFHGDADTTCPFADGKRTVASLKKLGFVSDLKPIRGVAHQFEPAAAGVMGCIDNAIRRLPVPAPAPVARK